MRNLKLCTLILLLINKIIAQNPITPSTPEQRKSVKSWYENAVRSLDHLSATNIGPTIMSGRISDIEVNPVNPFEFYVAYASGGLWYTKNNGVTFTPIFDNELVMTIGAFAVHWPTKTIYVGTGEVNASRSSYAGNGMYSSSDNGKSWSHIGLDESHHIGQVYVHPADKNHVVVSVLGHLYSPNVERGIYITHDGGKTWKHSLYVSQDAGSPELIHNPANPNELFASIWHRERRAWSFVEGGKTSGIYTSVDGGDTWKTISNPNSGFPNHENVGRIGLSISKSQDSTYLYAIVDNYNEKPKKSNEPTQTGLTKEKLKTMDKKAFAALADDDLTKYLKSINLPEKYDVKKVKEMIQNDKISLMNLVEYNEDANSKILNTEVIGAELYVSTNNGTTWRKTHKGYIDGLYNTYGYYFGQVRSSFNDHKTIYILGVPLLKSDDGGANWKSIDGDNVHSDHHCIWINEANPSHIINGNDGGINISYDSGASWSKCNTPAVGQFYYIAVDNEEPFNVYGGLQDNGVWYGKSDYKPSTSWHDSGQYPYKRLGGGDGMQVQIDNRDNNTIYYGSQFGFYFRKNKATGETRMITPKHELGDRPYRWNWQSPILLSPHNQDILYMGANKLLRSMDKGKSFKAISADLTNGGKVGDVPYGSLTTIDESILKFGLIYTGSDDGAAYATKDGGVSWTNISDGLPKDLWISRIIASKHEEGRVFVCLNGYRWDHFAPYLFMSNDYGKTWIDLSKALPHEAINVIKEDHEDADIIYVGSDHGTYVSIDMGSSFIPLSVNDLPRVAVHDIIMHEKTNQLVIGTHGRSIYKVNAGPIKKLKNIKSDSLFVFELNTLRHNTNWGKVFNVYTKPYTATSSLMMYALNPGKASIIVKGNDGKLLMTKDIELKRGIALYDLNWQIDQKAFTAISATLKKEDKDKWKMADDGFYYPIIGDYKLSIKQGSITRETVLKVK
jgi:photosystem II stability/assembly factor-like uncharacterized protein